MFCGACVMCDLTLNVITPGTHGTRLQSNADLICDPNIVSKTLTDTQHSQYNPSSDGLHVASCDDQVPD